jgi:hypothetical protein
VFREVIEGLHCVEVGHNALIAEGGGSLSDFTFFVRVIFVCRKSIEY